VVVAEHVGGRRRLVLGEVLTAEEGSRSGIRTHTKPPWHRRTHVGMRCPGHAAMGRRGPLVSGPCHFSNFLKIFHLPNFEIQNSDLPDVQNSLNFA
jgi:hypothetical protein